jgi:perosamine synthetase
MESLAEICDESGIYLIEDAAEAPYGEINGKKLGSFGIAASFSFYGNKIVSSGEGGAVTTSDLDLYKSMKLLRGQGMDPKRRYYFSEIGFNFRLTNIACAILCAQMERASEMIQTRNRIYEKYDSILRNHPYFSFQQSLPGHKTSPWLYTLLIKGVDSEKRDRIIFELASREVETRPIFIPIHTLPPYTRMRRDHLHKTDMLGQSGLSLPTFSSMKISDAERVAIHLLEVLENS